MKEKKDKIDKLLYKFINMSDIEKRNFMQNLSLKIEDIGHKIKKLEERQLKVFELYFKEHKYLNYIKLTNAYKKILEYKSKNYNNKILNLHKKSGELEIKMLYSSLVDKKNRGLQIEITK